MTALFKNNNNKISQGGKKTAGNTACYFLYCYLFTITLFHSMLEAAAELYVEMIIYEIHTRKGVNKLCIHLLPDFVNQVLLEDSYVHSFMYCLWLVLYYDGW